MKTVTLDFTEEDLKSNMGSIFSCAGYHATKRVVPSIIYFGGCFNGFYADYNGREVAVEVPEEIAEKLNNHAKWSYGELGGVKAEPFSCVIQVPDHIRTTQDNDPQNIQITSQLARQGRVARATLAFGRFWSSLLGRNRRV